jgi:hypothetical protein
MRILEGGNVDERKAPGEPEHGCGTIGRDTLVARHHLGEPPVELADRRALQ